MYIILCARQYTKDFYGRFLFSGFLIAFPRSNVVQKLFLNGIYIFFKSSILLSDFVIVCRFLTLQLCFCIHLHIYAVDAQTKIHCELMWSLFFSVIVLVHLHVFCCVLVSIDNIVLYTYVWFWYNDMDDCIMLAISKT